MLDGLERVQEDAGRGRVRGELSDQTLKLLLRALAAGLGRARALVTSRFPLVDLADWTNRGYRDTRLDDLTPAGRRGGAARLGRRRRGCGAARRRGQVGYHALSVAVIGSYLRFFAARAHRGGGGFDLDAVTGEDPKAAKLARVLAFYAERLPPDELELLTRLSVFPRGVRLGVARRAHRCRGRGRRAAGQRQAASRRAAEQPERARAGVRYRERHERDVDGTSVPAREVPGTARLPRREGVRRSGRDARCWPGDAPGDQAEHPVCSTATSA